jgi:hypothetical protein
VNEHMKYCIVVAVIMAVLLIIFNSFFDSVTEKGINCNHVQ